MNRWFVAVLLGGIVFGMGMVVSAGVPLNNLEGVGGIAFNPLAYPAVSVGGVWKHTSFEVPNEVEEAGIDFYAVVSGTASSSVLSTRSK